MSEHFDPYYEWLGIPPKNQPAHHYRLLGIELFEDNLNVIERAADRQMSHVRTFQTGKQALVAQRLLNELSAARLCLLQPDKKQEYDAALRRESQAAGSRPSAPAARPAASAAPLADPNQSVPPWWWILELCVGLVAILSLVVVISMLVNRGTPNGAKPSPAKPRGTSESRVADAQPPGARGNAPPSPAPGIAAAPPAADAPVPAPVPANEAPPVATTSPATGAAPPEMTSPTTPATAAPATAPRTKRALRLNGRQAILIENSTGLTDLTRDFTAEMWFRPVAQMPPTGYCLMGNASFAGSTEYNARLAGWLLTCLPSADASGTDNQLVIQWGTTDNKRTTAATSIAPLSAQWHHVAVCQRIINNSDGELRVWLDGSPVIEQDLVLADIAASPLEMGIGVPPYYVAGTVVFTDVRAVRISTGPRYTVQFSPTGEFEADTATLGLLDFADERADRIADLSGNGRTGRIVDGSWVPLDSAPVVPDPALLATLTRGSADGKLPLPDREALAKELAQLRETYKKELTAAKEPTDMVSLASELLRKSREEKHPVTKYALLDLALELTTRAGNVHYALRAVLATNARYDINLWERQAETISQVAADARSYADRRAVVETAISLLDQAVQDRAMEAADRLANSAQQTARRLKDPWLTRIAALRGREIALTQKSLAALDAAQKQLKEGTQVAAAHTVLGRFQVFLSGEWDEGLKHLVDGDDAPLQELARRELQQPSAPDDQLALATSWLNWAKAAKDYEQNVAWLRTQHWLELALPRLQGASRTQALKSLEDVAAKATPRSVSGVAVLADWLSNPVGELRAITAHSGPITALAASRSGSWVATGSPDNTVRAWDVQRGKMLSEITATVNNITAIALLPDERFVLVIGSRNALEIWNLATRRPVRELKTDAAVLDPRLSDDGQVLLWFKPAADSKNIVLADPSTGRGLRELNCPGTPTRLALSRTGTLAAVVNDRNGLGVTSLATGQIVTLAGHQDRLIDLAFSPDGRALAACSPTEWLAWDLATGSQPQRVALTGPPGRITVTTEGTRVITSGSGDELSVWNARSGALLATLSSPRPSGVNTTCIAVLPHGLGAVTGTSNGELRVWRLPD